MSEDDYLWDRSGRPDPEIERLEGALAPLRHEQRPLELPPALEEARERAPRKRPRLALPWSSTPSEAPRLRGLGARPAALLAAAALLVVVGAAWFLLPGKKAGWSVTRLQGIPRVGRTQVHNVARLRPGAWLETDSRSRARIEVGEIGEVTLEPNSRLRLLNMATHDHRLALARGKLHAFIVAPPRSFTIETPSASAVDLGCAYTLEVGADGGARVAVTSGWVSFEWRGREVFIPAGAHCDTRPGLGPGTPYRAGAEAALRAALTALDDPATTPGERAHALTIVLESARAEDALTLWHLLARLEGSERAAVFDRLAVLAPPPAGVTREGVLDGNRSMLDRWWDSLGLGDVEWWRMWQGDWPETT